MRLPLRLPTSHRARVRLLRRTLVVAVVALLAILLAFFRNTGESFDTPRSDEEAVVIREPKRVKPSRADRREASQTLGRFVRSAILRRHLASSWPLATPQMKRGTTYREWLAGNLPVYPYPHGGFAGAGWTLEYAYRGVMGYRVLILPKHNSAGARAGQQIYACELRDVSGRWLVDFCYPRKTLSG